MIHFLDANVFMYAAGTQHPLKAPCLQILSDIGNLPIQFSTNVEVIQEVLHRYVALRRHSDAVTVANSILTLVPTIYSLEVDDMRRTIQLCASYPKLTARDAIHASTMLNHGITIIISADAHFEGLPGINRINPMNWMTYRQTL